MTGGTAPAQAVIEAGIARMGHQVASALEGSSHALVSDETLLRRTILLGDAEVDQLLSEITGAALSLLEADDSCAEDRRFATAAVRTAMLIEWVGDIAVNVATLGGEAAGLPSPTGGTLPESLRGMGLRSAAMLSAAVDAFGRRQADALASLVDADKAMEDFGREMFRAVVAAGREPRFRAWGLRLEQIARQIEMAAHRAVSIGTEVWSLVHGCQPEPLPASFSAASL